MENQNPNPAPEQPLKPVEAAAQAGVVSGADGLKTAATTPEDSETYLFYNVMPKTDGAIVKPTVKILEGAQQPILQKNSEGIFFKYRYLIVGAGVLIFLSGLGYWIWVTFILDTAPPAPKKNEQVNSKTTDTQPQKPLAQVT